MTQSARCWAFLLALVPFVPGCMSFYERYHVMASRGQSSGANGDSEAPDQVPNTNYYRVTISGWTVLSTSQYASGWYDSEAVDSLFGELKGKTVKRRCARQSDQQCRFQEHVSRRWRGDQSRRQRRVR